MHKFRQALQRAETATIAAYVASKGGPTALLGGVPLGVWGVWARDPVALSFLQSLGVSLAVRRNESGDNLLHYLFSLAGDSWRWEETAKVLILSGQIDLLELQQPDNDDPHALLYSPLHQAAFHGSYAVCRLLLDSQPLLARLADTYGDAPFRAVVDGVCEDWESRCAQEEARRLAVIELLHQSDVPLVNVGEIIEEAEEKRLFEIARLLALLSGRPAS